MLLPHLLRALQSVLTRSLRPSTVGEIPDLTDTHSSLAENAARHALEMACMKPEQMELKNNLELHAAFLSSMVPSGQCPWPTERTYESRPQVG